jgi:hypothetical protein
VYRNPSHRPRPAWPEFEVPLPVTIAGALEESRQNTAFLWRHGLPSVPAQGNAARMQQPGFIAFHGFSCRDQERFLAALDALPESVRNHLVPLLREVHLVDALPPEVEGATMVREGVVVLNRKALAGADEKAHARPPTQLQQWVHRAIDKKTDRHWRQVVVHEVSHLHDWSLGEGNHFLSELEPGPLGQAPFVSWYAAAASERGQVCEDMAETATALAELRWKHGRTWKCHAKDSPHAAKFEHVMSRYWKGETP